MRKVQVIIDYLSSSNKAQSVLSQNGLLIQDPQDPKNPANSGSLSGSSQKRTVNILDQGSYEPKPGRPTHQTQLYGNQAIGASSAHDFSKKTIGQNLDIFKGNERNVYGLQTQLPPYASPYDKERASAATTTKFLDETDFPSQVPKRRRNPQSNTIEEWEKQLDEDDKMMKRFRRR